MRTSRRSFLKIGAVGGLGLVFLPAVKGFAGSGALRDAAGAGSAVGRKWAMVVDMQKCWERGAECRDCILACHRAHNVPEIPDPEEEVKWVWTERFEHAFPEQVHEYLAEHLRDKPFLVLCNHCENPPCVRVCPTKATFKGDGGLVMMDYHRCLGCRYCMAACPYGARSFNFRDPRPYLRELNPAFPTREKGVVEKCNFCTERLEEGLPPACVEACPAKALVFGDLDDPSSEVRRILSASYTIVRKPELGTRPKVYYVINPGLGNSGGR
ncbi:MAG TPA: 4Fe-4S ferredoxin [Peptococcaceae bacterium]|nr:4Fe-4S ferredoxin [Peptococcaceae bacterium]